MNGWFNVNGIVVVKTPDSSDTSIKKSADSPVPTASPSNVSSIDSQIGTGGIVAASVIGLIVFAGIIWAIKLS